MITIKEDENGLYLQTDGWIGRVREDEVTKFKKGDKVKAYHFGGSTVIGVGKDDTTTKKGKYLEYWRTTITYFEMR